MANVFVSYSHQDADRVRQLIDVLSRWGLSVVYDEHFERGEDWEKRIFREIAAADIVVVCWSSAAADSERVRDEALDAERLNKYLGCQVAPGGAPGRFGRKNHDDLTQWRGDDKDPRFLAFFSELGRRIGKDEIAGLEGAERQRLARIKKDQDAIEAAKRREKEIEAAKKAATIAAEREREEKRQRRQAERLRSFSQGVALRLPDPERLFVWNPAVVAFAFFPISILLLYILAAAYAFITDHFFWDDDSKWWFGIFIFWMPFTVLPWVLSGGSLGGMCQYGAACLFRGPALYEIW